MNRPLFATSFVRPAAHVSIAPQPLGPSSLPLLLLPVRLETRLFALAGGVTELRIRVYPDKIHLDSHETELTADEQTWGQAYWLQDWPLGSDAARRIVPWRQLADRFGAARAAWIRRCLQPTNLNQRPAVPVPAGQTPPAAPVFPGVAAAGSANAWRKAPQARLLPDRWVAVLHSGGQAMLSATGNTIRRPLAVGPDPNVPPPDAATEAAIRTGERSAIDDGMKWMVDFAEAEAAGMALRITVAPELLAAGLDCLLVFGAAQSLTPAATGDQLAGLLDAHHYTDGLEFLRHGTPTNNTEDRRAGFDSEDPGHARSFANEVAADPIVAPNASRLGRAFGLDAARIGPTLGHLARAADDHDGDQRCMNTALWPVGWGYFLSNMIGAESGLTVASADWARSHFLSHVRAGGPLPPLRCGAQPYGVLPVTSLDLWAAGAGEAVALQQTWLKGLLLSMREKLWRPVAATAARIGARTSPPDPDADLADVMRTDGLSRGHLVRPVFGRHYLEHLLALNGQDFTNLQLTQSIVSSRLVDLLGLALPASNYPHLARAFFDTAARALSAPQVQAGEVSPWAALVPNYIAALLAQPKIDALIAARPDPQATDNSTSLLQTLLRHALLREIANAAARIVATQPGQDLAAMLRDAELVDLVNAPPVNFNWQQPAPTLHWKRQLDLMVPAVTGGKTIRAFIEGSSDFSAPPLAALGELRASLARLQGLDSEALQLLMQGTLDLSANRLDAWITSFATQRLALMTAGGTVGQLVGGYGWVENLRPAPAGTALPAATLPASEAGPVFNLANDSGFIHAPTLTHAAAAALLRNAHLGPTGVPQADAPFAIELSSRRVREARRLLDGVRQGQPLAALLGYRFERRLHDLGLDRFVDPLRRVAPLMVRSREANSFPAEAVAANNVVDGWALFQKWSDNAASVLGALAAAVPPATPTESNKVGLELAALADTIDGLGDALTAETAYQVARGNTSRMASTLAAIAQGAAPPPELEVARMPRGGTPLTHRVAVLFSGGPQTPPGWAVANGTPRANAERMLNAWVTRLLGDARHVRCTVERLDDAGALAQTTAFPLSELPILALDFVYGVEPATRSTTSASPSTIEQWVLYQARRRSGGFGAAPALRLQHARPADLAAGELTLFDLLEQARAIRGLLENTRGLRPEDLNPASRAAQGAIDLVDLEARVTRIENGLNATHKQLTALVGKGPAAAAEDLRTGLLALTNFGVAQTIPSVPVGDDAAARAALLRQAAAALKESAARLDRGAGLRSVAAAADPGARCSQLFERAHAAFGASFVMLPNFSAGAAGAGELTSALAASKQTQGGDALASHGWFIRCARVRDPLARLAGCLRAAEVLATGEKLALNVVQLPFVSGERWVGLAPLPGTSLPANKLSLVVQSSAPLNPALALSGLLVDEWSELVPGTKETSALAFQFNPPNSCAPQSILIAVPPVPGQDWNSENLRQVLVETLDLAKLRAVDARALGPAAQYLPAIYLPFNAADDAVSTDFVPLTQ